MCSSFGIFLPEVRRQTLFTMILDMIPKILKKNGLCWRIHQLLLLQIIPMSMMLMIDTNNRKGKDNLTLFISFPFNHKYNPIRVAKAFNRILLSSLYFTFPDDFFLSILNNHRLTFSLFVTHRDKKYQV